MVRKSKIVNEAVPADERLTKALKEINELSSALSKEKAVHAQKVSFLWTCVFILYSHDFFLNLIVIYLLNIQIQISLMIDNLYPTGLITGISSGKYE